jgi:predicted nucleic acid-binding protein
MSSPTLIAALSKGDALLLDTCIAVNLCVAGITHEIPTALGLRLQMAEPAHQEITEEFVAELEDIGISRSQVDGFEVLKLNIDEIALFVDLTSLVDDGEAASLAIAKLRNVRLASDDRKARSTCRNLGLTEAITTPQLLRTWADSGTVDEGRISAAIRAVQDIGRYAPRSNDPNSDWWEKHYRQDYR